MPQLLPVIAAAVTASAPLAGTSLLAAGQAAALQAAIGSAIVSAFKQIAIGLALSALSRAIVGGPEMPGATGVKTSVEFGEDKPATITLGRYATPGDLLYAGSHGEDGDTPNAYYTMVFELADFPASLRRILVNGEWVTRSGSWHEDYGRPIREYRHKGRDYLWTKYYDGNQTKADPGLVKHYGDGERPWNEDFVGAGIPYCIVTALAKPEVHHGVPQLLFELDGSRLYDPRRDSSVGGSGSQRWSDRSTWGGPGDENPIVQIYNILRGLRDPITGHFLWGGQGIAARDLPLSNWFAAMNECDREIDGAPQYRSGLEIRLDQEPAAVIEEILKACQGEIAEVAGVYTVRAGPPTLPVFAFTDADIVTDIADEFDPFPALDAVFNGVRATYPDPSDGWESREAPPRLRSDYQAADGDRLQVADLSFPAVCYGDQVQRLMRSALEDQRRFRRHTLALPPEARALAPLDTVSWTSARHGYSAKHFTIDMIEDAPAGCVLVLLREVDPSDYDWSEDYRLPSSVGFTGRPPRLALAPDFSVEADSIQGPDGGPRRPALRLNWRPDRPGVTGIQYQIRLANGAQTAKRGSYATADDAEKTGLNLELFPGVPLEANPGRAVEIGYFADEELGTLLISEGILPAQAYQVRARYRRPGRSDAFSPWLPVTTFDVRIPIQDITPEIVEGYETAQATANKAVADAFDAGSRADQAVAGIASAESKADQALELAMEAANAAGTVGRLLAGGWLADPSFEQWTGAADLTRWTELGTGGTLAQASGGFFTYSVDIDAPASTFAGIEASSATAGQASAALNLGVEFVVVSLMVEYLSGDLAAGRARVQWLIGGVWTNGAFPLAETTAGVLDKIGVTPNAGAKQLVQFVQQKPAGAATALRLVYLGGTLDGGALHTRVHSFDVRQATASEIEAVTLRTHVDTELTALGLTVQGIDEALSLQIEALGATVGSNAAAISAETVARANQDSALAAQITTLGTRTSTNEAAIGAEAVARTTADGALSARINTVSAATAGNSAAITDRATALAEADAALASRMIAVEAVRDGANLVRNPQFADGARPVGQAPDFWSNWPSSWRVIAKGSSGGNAVQTMPTPFAVEIPADASANTQATAAGAVPCKEGDRILVRYRFATGGSDPRSADFRAVAHFRDADGGTTGFYLGSGPNGVSSTAWATGEREWTAPAGTASVAIAFRRAAGGSGTGYLADFEARKVDPALQQRLEAVIALRADAGNPAELQLVSLGNGQVAESIARLRADKILLEGSVAARHLVVGDFSNMVPDSQMQDAGSWRLSGVSAIGAEAIAANGWGLFASGGYADFPSKGRVQFDRAGRSGASSAYSQPFAVEPGDALFARGYMDGDGRAYSGRLALRFYDRTGAFLAIEWIGATGEIDTDATVARSQVLTVPAGAQTARVQLYADAPASASSYVRFFGVSVRRLVNSVEIKDGAIVAEKINVAKLSSISADLGTIQVDNAHIKNLTVNGEKIANFAVTRQSFSSFGSDWTPSFVDQWFTIIDVAITRRAGSMAAVHAWVAWKNGQGEGSGMFFRLQREETTLVMLPETRSDTKGTALVPWADLTDVEGAKSYKLQAFIPSRWAGVTFDTRTLLVIEHYK